MSPIERFRQSMREGRLPVGVMIGFTDPLVSDAIADSIDFLWIDLEHSAMSPEALAGHLLAARSRSRPAIVRVAAPGVAFVKPVLDAGADGIIVPMVRTVDEVHDVVECCRYPPAGSRGFGPRISSNYGRIPTPQLVETANRELFTCVMIETREALEDIEAIVSVPGLDSVAIGPWDLSGSLGMLGEVEHPKVIMAIDRIITAARTAGIFVGVGMGIQPEWAISLARRGCQWILIGSDHGYLVWSVDGVVATIRQQWNG
jgi:2-keto-3-deoxy-L-rhamnonate aldolase RhmA